MSLNRTTGELAKSTKKQCLRDPKQWVKSSQTGKEKLTTRLTKLCPPKDKFQRNPPQLKLLNTKDTENSQGESKFYCRQNKC